MEFYLNVSNQISSKQFGEWSENIAKLINIDPSNIIDENKHLYKSIAYRYYGLDPNENTYLKVEISKTVIDVFINVINYIKSIKNDELYITIYNHNANLVKIEALDVDDNKNGTVINSRVEIFHNGCLIYVRLNHEYSDYIMELKYINKDLIIC